MIFLYLTLSGREQMLGQHTDENHGAANVLGVFTLCRAAHTSRRQESEKKTTISWKVKKAQPAITSLFTLSSVGFSFYFIFCLFCTLLLNIQYVFVGGVQRRNNRESQNLWSRHES